MTVRLLCVGGVLLAPLVLLCALALAATGVCTAPPRGPSSSMVSSGGADVGAPSVVTLAPSDIARVAAEAGFSGADLQVAVAVALAESGGRADIDNAGLNRDGSIDYGLWQINSVHEASGFDSAQAADPAYNARWARRVFLAAGGRWTPWVTYNNGDYLRHMATAASAVRATPRAAERRSSTTSPASSGGDARMFPVACSTGLAMKTVSGEDPAGAPGPITDAELDAVAAAIGAPVPDYSVLRDPAAYGTGHGGPSVNLLAAPMKVAVARLEVLMGTRLLVTSGFRTAAYQAELCTRVSGPCAPPGRSMHQLGLAVDVRNWRSALPFLSTVGLCQPLPSNDAVHLSHVSGTEC